MNMGVRIAGFMLVALGLLAILMTLFSSETLVNGVTLDTGVLLLVGGVVTLGLSGVMSAIETLRMFVAGEDQAFAASLEETRNTARTATGAGYTGGSKRPTGKLHDSARRSEPPFSARGGDASKGMKEQASPPADKAGAAVDKPVEDIRETGLAESAPSSDAVSEEELYVVEERTIAGKPARVLSDGTVEAETDDGWMRFENVQHLEEYMEALRVQRG